MKGEYVEDNQGDNNNNNNHHAIPLQTHHPTPNPNPNPHNIFPKYPPPHHLHHHQHPHHPHSFLSPTPPTNPTKKPKTTPILTTPPQTQDDGGTVETSRKPRGRPPGSKNKPKPPIIITREPDQPNMSPYILELPNSSDMVESLTRFTRRRGVSLCVLTASGAVSNLVLRQPSTSSSAPPATVTFHGRFEILSLSAVVLLNESNNSLNFNLSFTISVAGPQGQIVGGKVAGPLVTAGTVYVIAASFNSPSFQRLPLEDTVQQPQEVRNDGVSRSEDDEGRNDAVSGGSVSVSGGGPVGMYSCQDVIWAPTPARPHQPPQHQQQHQAAPPY